MANDHLADQKPIIDDAGKIETWSHKGTSFVTSNKDVIREGLTSLNVSIMEFSGFYLSIETKLVTHFSGYKTITLHEKAMLYVLNHDVRFFAY